MTRHVEVMDLVAQLKAAEEAFVLATVVRTVSVTAAKAGAKAIIRPDGTIVAGWIGGGCARGAVLKAARDALADGEPRMVSVQPENLLAELGVKPGENRDGVRFAENMCPSKGTMDVFVEPVLPHPSLVILGVSPVALSLATQARQLGYHVTLAAPVRRPDGHARRRHADRRLCARKAQPGKALRRGLDPGQGRRSRTSGGGCDRGRLSRLRRQPPQDGGAARETDGGRYRGLSDRPHQGARRSRSRRHHAGRNRDVDPGRDHDRAAAGTARGGRGSNGRHREEREATKQSMLPPPRWRHWIASLSLAIRPDLVGD